ncbi:MAG: nucleotide exchange factor GrpE [Opitutaceae bacterium]
MTKAKQEHEQEIETTGQVAKSTQGDVPGDSDALEVVEGAEPTLEQQLEAARAEVEANRNLHLRAVADLENYRRRSVREREELRQFATSSLVEDLLPILDNLALGIASARQEADPKAVADGVSMVLDQFKGVLNRSGLVEINPAPGDAFDPHQHESLAHQPSDSVAAEAILQVVRVGYSLNGRLLRAASVILSSGPAAGKNDRS